MPSPTANLHFLLALGGLKVVSLNYDGKISVYTKGQKRTVSTDCVKEALLSR